MPLLLALATLLLAAWVILFLLVTATILAVPIVAMLGLLFVKVRAPIIKYHSALDALSCAAVVGCFITLSVVVVQVALDLLHAAPLNVPVGLDYLASQFSRVRIDALVFAGEATLTLFVTNRLAVHRAERGSAWATAALAAAFGALIFAARHLPAAWSHWDQVPALWNELLANLDGPKNSLWAVYQELVGYAQLQFETLLNVNNGTLFSIAEGVCAFLYPAMALLFMIASLTSLLLGARRGKLAATWKYSGVEIPVVSLTVCVIIMVGLLLWFDWFRQMYGIYTLRLPPDKLKSLQEAPLHTLYFNAMYVFGGVAAPIVWVFFPIAYAKFALRVYDFLKAP
jgi:hypothetical protein